ncbi:MAG TPA: cobalamin-dependent protein [Anaerolineae bacterium]
MQDYPLAAYADNPIYNMKAVTQRTGIPAATLRAWERRYHALAPRRSNGNYRLYSERDIAILGWLQAQLDAGLSISRAVTLLEHLRENDLAATLPAYPAISNSHAENTQPALHPATSSVANWDQLQTALLNALLSMDEHRAGEVLAEAFALYTVEDLCSNLIAPVLVRIGEAWSTQVISVAQEHFSSAYLVARLMTLFNSAHLGSGPAILVSCAPGERHELGALMLALLLRRAGHNVCYLGADLPLADLIKVIREQHPRMVAISAVMPQSLAHLETLAQLLQVSELRTRLVFGGQAFGSPEARNMRFHCDYIGSDLRGSLNVIEDLLISEPAPLGPAATYGSQAGIVASSAS